jgi:hypothetical protein
MSRNPFWTWAFCSPQSSAGKNRGNHEPQVVGEGYRPCVSALETCNNSCRMTDDSNRTAVQPWGLFSCTRLHRLELSLHLKSQPAAHAGNRSLRSIELRKNWRIGTAQ